MLRLCAKATLHSSNGYHRYKDMIEFQREARRMLIWYSVRRRQVRPRKGLLRVGPRASKHVRFQCRVLNSKIKKPLPPAVASFTAWRASSLGWCGRKHFTDWLEYAIWNFSSWKTLEFSDIGISKGSESIDSAKFQKTRSVQKRNPSFL